MRRKEFDGEEKDGNEIDFDFILRKPTLYYPGSGDDFEPLKLFTQDSDISTVIYCDYMRSVANGFIDRVREDLNEYNVISINPIDPHALGCNSWRDFRPKDMSDHPLSSRRASGILIKMFFEPDNKVINLIFLGTEAVQTYKILFSDRRINPNVVVIDRYMDKLQFCGEDSELYKIAMPALPRFLYTRGDAWPGYEPTSDEVSHARSLYVYGGEITPEESDANG